MFTNVCLLVIAIGKLGFGYRVAFSNISVNGCTWSEHFISLQLLLYNFSFNSFRNLTFWIVLFWMNICGPSILRMNRDGAFVLKIYLLLVFGYLRLRTQNHWPFVWSLIVQVNEKKLKPLFWISNFVGIQEKWIFFFQIFVWQNNLIFLNFCEN